MASHVTRTQPNGDSRCDDCGAVGINDAEIDGYWPYCYRQMGHILSPMPSTGGFECDCCKTQISYAAACQGGQMKQCAGVSTGIRYINSSESIEFISVDDLPAIAKAWKHGFCSYCRVELCPPLDGYGVTECARCSR